MAGTKSKSDKKDRHRKSAQNLRYINERRHEKSHVRRLVLHLQTQPDDGIAKKALQEYSIRAGGWMPTGKIHKRPHLRG